MSNHSTKSTAQDLPDVFVAFFTDVVAPQIYVRDVHSNQWLTGDWNGSMWPCNRTVDDQTALIAHNDAEWVYIESRIEG